MGFLCFFFSSRRRHTRFDCDWSSDVCSSDLALLAAGQASWAGEAEAKKGIDAGFQPSTLSKDQQMAEMKWFIEAAKKLQEIGRASCRERVEISVGAGSLKKKKRKLGCARILG